LPTVLRRTRLIQGFGAVACAAALACALLSARGALTGWLAASVVLQSVPLAGLMLLALMRLFAGEWGRPLRPIAEAAARLWPVAALAFVPVLLGLEVIYDWGRDPVSGALAAGWLGYVQYGVRTTIRFMVFAIVARSQIGRQASPVASALGLGVLVVGTSVTALDWLMSLDTGYHPSIFSLQVLSLEVTAGYLVLLIAGLLRHPAPERVGRLGALLLTFQLVWAYLQFLPVLMLATGELPGPAAWYAERLHGPWLGTTASAVVLGVGPILALLSSRVRTRRGLLLAVAGVALAGKVIEFAWLTLPGRGGVAVLAYALALVGFACVIAVRLRPSEAAVTT
jgi:hypothetical protein